MCSPTVSPTSREATTLSARVSTQASEFLGTGARGNMWAGDGVPLALAQPKEPVRPAGGHGPRG